MNEPDQNNQGRTQMESSSLSSLFSPPPSSDGRKDEKAQDSESPEKKGSQGNDNDDDDAADHHYNDVQQAQANIDAPAGSISYMMGLFAPVQTTSDTPPATSSGFGRPPLDRQSTAPRSNRFSDYTLEEDTPLLSSPSWENSGFSHMDSTPKVHGSNKKFYGDTGGLVQHAKLASIGGGHHTRLSSFAMPVIQETSTSTLTSKKAIADKHSSKFLQFIKSSIKEAVKPTTFIGSFMFLLYHVVFSLAIGSAIYRPHSSTSILGLMTKTAALGIIFSSPAYWLCLSSEIPALYPTVDLFLAPFLANLAIIVDQTLSEDPNILPKDNDTIFLATLGVLAGLGTSFAGCLLLLASVFKLANMGSYLPFPVICGFFAAVGILTWTLSVSVDTGGISVGKILLSGDSELIIFAIVHHIPTVIVASFMKYLGPKNPLYVVMVVLVTIVFFYIVMFLTGISLDEAKAMGWFWSHDELVYKSDSPILIGFESWAPPAPFGVFHELFTGKVHWTAVYNGMSTTLALGFLYMIRCSVHGTALKKNLPNLVRKARADDPVAIASPKLNARPPSIKSRTFSEAVDIEAVMQHPSNENGGGGSEEVVEFYHAKPTNIPLKAIMAPYAFSQFLSALVGGFAITPSVAASPTMFMLGAEKVAPQFGAVLLLLSFYLTDFQLVGYIPKPAFSAMLFLAFIDMTYTWFYKSYFRTQNKLEWMVVPLIVICAFAVDLLSSVFLGIAFSTFIFVTSIFRSGVVKYVANGLVVHSTIERSFKSSEWLNENGDLIQIMVLQNYLFFGNATSVYNFIGKVFFRIAEDPKEKDDDHRKPKFLIIDLALVTGMDTSTVGVFSDIRNLCNSNNCKLLMSGMSQNIRSLLSLGGFKADTGVRSKRKLRFFPNLDSAVGKAEDMLLESDFEEKVIPESDARRRLLSEGDHGFRTALRQIDEEHGDGFSMELLPLQEFTQPVELNTGDKLYEGDDPLERGLFFIENGVLKIEHDTAATMTRNTFRNTGASSLSEGDSLTKIQAKSISRLVALMGQSASGGHQSFRVARIGPGWVAGTLEAVAGVRPTGDHVAVTHCRLHHLPFSKLEEVEEKNPALVLKLYKLLSYLMARRQEATIGQLATLHSIMASPANYQSLGKKPQK